MINSINPTHFFPDYTGKFGDKRLEKRAKNLWSRLSDRPSSSIRQISTNKAEQKAFYRFLHNDSVKEDHLIEESSNRMSKLSHGRHLLCLQDTCEVNLSQHKGRIKENSGLGSSDKSDTGHCFKLHPGLVLDASTFSPLGLSHIKIYHRPEDTHDRFQRNYKAATYI